MRKGCSKLGIRAGTLVLASMLGSRVASAQSAPERAAMAQGLYEAAAVLLKEGRYAEACPKLEESQRLDPAAGTQFFLADCYENTGRPTSAWSLFVEVAASARAAGNQVRESTARGRAAALERRLPRLTITVAPALSALPGLAITRNGVEIKQVAWGAAVPVDFGDHVVLAAAPGKASWRSTVRVDRFDQRIVVAVPPLEDAAVALASRDATLTPAPRRATLAPQRVAALAVGGLSVAGLVAGGVLGGVTASTWERAKAACPARTACSEEAHDQSRRALSLATGSTISFAIGGAGVAAGLIL